MDPAIWARLIEVARKARANAYAPYSGYRVGAAVLGDDGEVHAGCNVENSSFGATICAERVAATQAVARGTKRLEAAVVLTESSPPAPPCGICLQVLAELGGGALSLLLLNPEGERRELRLSELLPTSFGPAALGGKGRPLSGPGPARD